MPGSYTKELIVPIPMVVEKEKELEKVPDEAESSKEEKIKKDYKKVKKPSPPFIDAPFYTRRES